MTTKVHVVNFGPSPVKVTPTDPDNKNQLSADEVKTLVVQESADFYVHSVKSLEIKEWKP